MKKPTPKTAICPNCGKRDKEKNIDYLGDQKYQCSHCKNIEEKKLLGYAGVDSGQLMVCDPCYIGSEWQKDDDKIELLDKINKDKFSYGGCCLATLGKNNGGQLNYKLGHKGAGVAFSTGYGDGTYPVYAEYGEDNRIMKITIEFN